MHKLKVLFAVLCAYSLAGCVNDDGILRSDGLFANMNENYIDFDAEGASKVVVGMEMGEAMYLIRGNPVYINRTTLGYCHTYQQMHWTKTQLINVCFDEEEKVVTYVRKDHLE